MVVFMLFFFFFFNDTATTEIYTLSLHDALPIFHGVKAPSFPSSRDRVDTRYPGLSPGSDRKSTPSELQSPCNLVCRLLLEKKKKNLTNLTILERFLYLSTSS